MAEPAVANASPLILLQRAGHLDLLRVASDEIIVPAAVEAELRRGRNQEKVVEAIAQAPWITVVPIASIPSTIQAWDLGPGESAVLAWAESHRGCEAVLDDLPARRCAAAINVPVRGTLGIVLLAKERGIIALARPALARSGSGHPLPTLRS